MKKNLFAITILLLTAVACQQEAGNLPEPAKTPLTLGSINITTTEGEPTRATSANDFFRHNDQIALSAKSTLSGGNDYSTSFIFDKPEGATTGTWELTKDKAPIYLEDVYGNGKATHNLTISFGGPSENQSAAESFRLSDEVSGDAKLVTDANGRPTGEVHAEKLERQCIRVELTITEGKRWNNDIEFSDFLAAHDACFVNFYTPYQPENTTGVYHVIMPVSDMPASGKALFELRKSGTTTAVATCYYTMTDNDYEHKAGTRITISAALDKNNGILGTPTINIDTWKLVNTDTPLPGERQ